MSTVPVGKRWPTRVGVQSDEPGEASATHLRHVDTEVGHGDVLIAAITSCTNTSNPSVMLAAGILAKKAVARGIRDYVAGGGFLFAMCTATETIDLALAAEGADIAASFADGTPLDPQVEGRLYWSRSFAFRLTRREESLRSSVLISRRSNENPNSTFRGQLQRRPIPNR
jgi:hypothetical protein